MFIYSTSKIKDSLLRTPRSKHDPLNPLTCKERPASGLSYWNAFVGGSVILLSCVAWDVNNDLIPFWANDKSHKLAVLLSPSESSIREYTPLESHFLPPHCIQQPKRKLSVVYCVQVKVFTAISTIIAYALPFSSGGWITLLALTRISGSSRSRRPKLTPGRPSIVSVDMNGIAPWTGIVERWSPRGRWR